MRTAREGARGLRHAGAGEMATSGCARRAWLRLSYTCFARRRRALPRAAQLNQTCEFVVCGVVARLRPEAEPRSNEFFLKEHKGKRANTQRRASQVITVTARASRRHVPSASSALIPDLFTVACWQWGRSSHIVDRCVDRKQRKSRPRTLAVARLRRRREQGWES